MASSAGKRMRELQKVEKAQAKASRKAARASSEEVQSDDLPKASEAELIGEIAALHKALESGDISLLAFEERRGLLQVQLAKYSR